MKKQDILFTLNAVFAILNLGLFLMNRAPFNLFIGILCGVSAWLTHKGSK